MNPPREQGRTQERIGDIIDAARSAFAAHAQGIDEAALRQLRIVHEQSNIAMQEIVDEQRWQREQELERTKP
jgi:hypothetical protein